MKIIRDEGGELVVMVTKADEVYDPSEAQLYIPETVTPEELAAAVAAIPAEAPA